MKFYLPFYILLASSFVLLSGSASGQVAFKTEIDAKQVVEGGTFNVEFIITNGDPSNFDAPDFKPFKIISGPSQSYRSSFINGKGTKSVSYGYTLLATKIGTFHIAGATATINGAPMKSNPVRLEVLKSNAVSQNGVEQIYIRAEVDSTMAYIGQQVLLKYKIYTQINIENYNILSESAYPGCYSQALIGTYKHPVIKEVIEGVQYTTKVLREVALFPQQGGKIDIEPFVVQVGIPSGKVRRGLFSSYGTERRNLTSNALTLHVKSAYEGAPTAFSGAVGRFGAKINVSPTSVTTDDAISVLIHLEGDGDVKTVRPPDLQLPSHFEVYDPKIKQERMINTSDSIRGEKTIEYLVLGNEPGTYEIAPSLVYFDPFTSEYKVLSDTFQVTITPGSGTRQSLSNQDNNLQNLGNELADISHDLELKKVRKPLYLRPWYMAGYVVPVLAFVLLSWRSNQKNKNNIEEVDPSAEAKERLQASKALMEQRDFKQFYEEVAYSLKHFITHQLQIPNADLSKQKIKAILEEHQLDRIIVDKTQELLDRCDYALYAGQVDHHHVEKTYDEALELMTELSQI